MTTTSGCRPDESGKVAEAARDRAPAALDRAGGGLSAALGLHPTAAAAAANRPTPRLARATRSMCFILTELEREGLKPSPEASKDVLLGASRST